MTSKKNRKPRSSDRAARRAYTRSTLRSKPKLQRVDPAAVDRIIKATHSAPGAEKLAAVDRRELQWDLNFALAIYGTAFEFGSDTAKRRDDRWRAIHLRARELLRLLREDERDKGMIGRHYPHTMPGPRLIILEVAFAAIAARRKRKKPEQPESRRIADDPRRWLTARSPANFFDGEILYPLFQEHFEVEGAADTTPAYTTTDGDTDSPFMRFADQVFREFGIKHGGGKHYQRSFFASAVAHARKKRSRRKEVV